MEIAWKIYVRDIFPFREEEVKKSISLHSFALVFFSISTGLEDGPLGAQSSPSAQVHLSILTFTAAEDKTILFIISLFHLFIQ